MAPQAPRAPQDTHPAGQFEVFRTVIPPDWYRWRLVSASGAVTLTSAAAFRDEDAAMDDAVGIRDTATAAPVVRVGAFEAAR
jgi:hypothetical protein